MQFKVKFSGQIFTFKFCEKGLIWFKDGNGAWTNVNQRLPIKSLNFAKVAAFEMLSAAGY